MSVIIDGYNFLFADRRDMLRLESGELERMRQDFLGRLARLSAVESSAITVVFDGGPDSGVHVRESNYHSVKVVFSDRNRTADTEIVRLLEDSTGARDTVVVTNDNELRRNCKRLGANVTSVEEFKKHMKNLFKGQSQVHREPLEKYEGVRPDEVDFWMQQFGAKDEDETPDGGSGE